MTVLFAFEDELQEKRVFKGHKIIHQSPTTVNIEFERSN